MKKIAVSPKAAVVRRASKDCEFAVRLMEHLVVPTFVLDRESRVIIWNKACERLTGVAASEVLGTREHWRAFYDVPRPCLADLLLHHRETEAVSLYAAHSDIVSTRDGVFGENWCVMPKSTKRLYLAIDAGPIFDEKGELIAVVESLRDITAQKLAEAELRGLASKDGLTSIGNRRFFDECLEDEWRRALRQGTPLSLLLLDIDYFKHYNDAFGHQRGDECLRLCAATMARQLMRPGDVAARYGGEEFAAILPDTDREGALEVAERIRAAIKELGLPNPAPLGCGHVSASIGLASVNASPKHRVEKLVCFADIALYRAKESGRNSVVAYDDTLGCRNAAASRSRGSEIPIISSPHCAACRLQSETDREGATRPSVQM